MSEVRQTDESSKKIEFDKAQKIFLDLLRDNRTLEELGYTPEQISYVSPIITLLQGVGKKNPSSLHFQHSTIDFTNPIMPKAKARIEAFSDHKGFILSATRNLPNPSDQEAVRKAIDEDHVFPVPMWTPEVVRIALFTETESLEDLNFLVPHLVTNWTFVSPPLGMKPKSPATAITERIGLNSTFKAAWTDEFKSEFLTELSSPLLKKGPEEVAFRRLHAVSTPHGTYIPFGMKSTLASAS